MRYVVVACAAVLVLGSSACAETYLVDPDSTIGDFPNIQAAVDSVADGDVIELADGVFQGPGNRDMRYLGKHVTIRSRSGDPALCIIDCQGSEVDPHRAFTFTASDEETAVLEGVTIRNGHATGDDWGGGALNLRRFSHPTVRNCVFRQNVAELYGGAIYTRQAWALITDCVFLENFAERGGALASSGWAEIGGTVSRCSFIANSSTREGGALWMNDDFAIEACTFSYNHCDGDGGAVYFSYPMGLDRCTFWRNTADSRGGACFLSGYSEEPRLTNCTLVENSASAGGGAYLTTSEMASLENTIIAFSLEGGAVECADTGQWLWLSCCDIFGNAGGDWIGCIADQCGAYGNLSADPLFCDAASGNFSLHADSPCAPFSPQNPECDLVGAWPVGCSPSSLPETVSGISSPGLQLLSPNPFVARTRIRYTVSAGAGVRPVDLSIHDCSGRLVRSLVGGALSSGERIACWDGADGAGRQVPGGVYFCRLAVGGQEFSRPVLKLR